MSATCGGSAAHCHLLHISGQRALEDPEILKRENVAVLRHVVGGNFLLYDMLGMVL